MLELWGGVECTVARIGDRYVDQLHTTGHHDRACDLDDFAALGLAAIRYPVLWERIAPERPDRCDWSWTDERLARLRDLGIRPILGLVHHGSGPRYTTWPTRASRGAWVSLRPGSPSVTPGRKITRESTSRSPPRASADCTDSGIRTDAIRHCSCACCSINWKARGRRCVRFGRSPRRPG